MCRLDLNFLKTFFSLIEFEFAVRVRLRLSERVLAQISRSFQIKVSFDNHDPEVRLPRRQH